MRSPSPSRRLLMLTAAAGSLGACCLLALVLAVGVCTAGSGGVVHGQRPRPPSASPVLLGVDSPVRATLAEEEYDVAGGDVEAVRGGRDLLGLGAEAAVEQDYGNVDPPPDTHHRGGAAPIPHS